MEFINRGGHVVINGLVIDASYPEVDGANGENLGDNVTVTTGVVNLGGTLIVDDETIK